MHFLRGRRFSSRRLPPGAALLFCFALGATLTAGIPEAFAGTAASSYGYTGTVYGYSYYDYAEIVTGGSQGLGDTGMGNTSGNDAPTGYMGVQAFLTAASNNATCTNTGWSYTSAPTVATNIPTNTVTCPAGNYYSQGFARAYNGNGYNTYTTPRTPNQPIA